MEKITNKCVVCGVEDNTDRCWKCGSLMLPHKSNDSEEENSDDQ